MGSWYEKSFRRNLVDMHINDSDPVYMSQYDPVKYVENLITAEVDTAILYAGNCLGICFWPTRVGHMHASLQGRDILGDTIAECRKRGLNVIVYFNIWSRWAYDTHPEWRYRDSMGRGMFVESDGQRYGMCCSNTGYAEYVYTQVDDLASHYDMDGFWVDMIGWFGGICFCDACKKRYRHESGDSFPSTFDWREARFRNFQQRRETWHAEFAQKIRETVLARKPGISVVFQAASWKSGWKIGLSEALYSQSDYLAGDFYGDPVEQSFVCKYLESVSNHKPIEFMSSRCPNLSEHTVTKQRELLEAQVYSSIANNASYVFIDAIDPAGTLDPAPYRTMGRIFSQSRLFESYLGPQLKRKADVAIYVDIHSLASMQDNGKILGTNSSGRPFGNDLTDPPSRKLPLIAESFIHHKIAYDVITRKSINHLADYQVLILPNTFMLSQVEADAIREYANGGGSVYASKHSSLINGQGDFLLSDVFGVSYAGETDEDITYIAPRSEYSGLDSFTEEHPLTVYDTQTRVIPLPNTEVLATLTLPYTRPRDAYEYSTAISNPPGRLTDNPALVHNRFGKGSCVYCAGTLEFMPHDAQRRVFVGIVRSLMTRCPCFETDAPRPVEIMVYDDPISSRMLVCILNFQSILPAIPIHEMNISINMGVKSPISIVQLPGEGFIPWREQDGFVSFVAEKTDIFSMYAVYYK